MVIVDWFPGLTVRDKVVKANKIVEELTINEVDCSAHTEETLLKELNEYFTHDDEYFNEFVFITHNKTFEKLYLENRDIRLNTILIMPDQGLLKNPDYHNALLNDNGNIDDIDDTNVEKIATEFHDAVKNEAVKYMISVSFFDKGFGNYSLKVLQEDMVRRMLDLINDLESEEIETEVAENTGSFDENGERIPEGMTEA